MLDINIIIFGTIILILFLYCVIQYNSYYYIFNSFKFDYRYIIGAIVIAVFVYLLINQHTSSSKYSNLTYKDVKYKEPDVKITMTVYYSPECKYSREFIANEWKRYKDYVKENWAESVITKEISCIESPDKCKNINSYPTIIMEKYKKKYDFQSIRTVENLLTFTEQHLS